MEYKERQVRAVNHIASAYPEIAETIWEVPGELINLDVHKALYAMDMDFEHRELARAAVSIWGGDEKVRLGYLCNKLSDKDFKILLEALAMVRGIEA